MSDAGPPPPPPPTAPWRSPAAVDAAMLAALAPPSVARTAPRPRPWGLVTFCVLAVTALAIAAFVATRPKPPERGPAYGPPAYGAVEELRNTIKANVGRNTRDFCTTKRPVPLQQAYVAGAPAQWAEVWGARDLPGALIDELGDLHTDVTDGEFSLGSPVAKGTQHDHVAQAVLAVCIVPGTNVTVPDKVCHYRPRYGQYGFDDGVFERGLELGVADVAVYEVRTGTLLLRSSIQGGPGLCPNAYEGDGTPAVGIEEDDLIRWGQAHLAGGTVH